MKKITIILISLLFSYSLLFAGTADTVRTDPQNEDQIPVYRPSLGGVTGAANPNAYFRVALQHIWQDLLKSSQIAGTVQPGVNNSSIVTVGPLKTWIDSYSAAMFWGETWKGYGTLTPGQTSPVIQKDYIYDCTGATTVSIVNFVYSSGSPQTLDKFGIFLNSSLVTLVLKDNSYIKGNSNNNHTGSTTETELIFFMYIDPDDEGPTQGYWQCSLIGGWINPSSLAFSSLDTPTLKTSELYDNGESPPASPFTLIADEMKGCILTNSDMTAAGEWIAPQGVEGFDGCFEKKANYNVLISPYSGEQFYFRNSNGPYTLLSVDEGITNTASEVSTLCWISDDDGDILFTGSSTNWVEETP